MRRIALMLLIVAARAQKPEKNKASVLFSDSDDIIVGAINFLSDAINETDVYIYCRLWGLPHGAYIAVVHDCSEDNIFQRCERIGPPRAKDDQIEDPTEGREPMTIFRRQWKNSTDTGFTVIAKDLTLGRIRDHSIIDSVIAIYRDTSSGLKLCPKSRKDLSSKKTASPVAWGFVNEALINNDGPLMPEIFWEY